MSKKQSDAPTSIEEKYEEVRQLIAMGKERGFLSYEEINDALPDELGTSAEAIEDVFSLLETHGIGLVDADVKEALTRPETPPRPNDKLALYMRNRPEYMITLAACFKARLVQVNVNFRYQEDELWYILDNSDARFVIFDREFQEQVEKLRPRSPKVDAWLQVGGTPLPFA